MSGTILVIDDVATNRIVMKVKLASACYDVLLADSGAAGIEMARERSPDLILLDVLIPDMDGFAVCERLKSDPRTSTIPVIMITTLDDTEARLRGLACGAEEFLTKPISELTLLARVRSLLRSRSRAAELMEHTKTPLLEGFAETAQAFEAAPKDSVGLLLARDGVGARWAEGLRGRIREDVRILSRNDALGASKDQSQVFIIEADPSLPDHGIQILSDLRSRPSTRHAGQIFIAGAKDAKLAAQALDLGADDVIYAPVSLEEMSLRLRAQLQRKRTTDRLRGEMSERLRMAVIDPLTGLYNRRFGMSQLANLSAEAAREGTDFAILLLDFDHFKSINDRYGHAAGDHVLRDTADRIRMHLRSLDIVARIGGEEFMIVLPETDIKTAATVAERLRARIEAAPFHVPPPVAADVGVTISIGLASGGRSHPHASVSDILDRADRALYSAKADGRNQVAISSGRSAA